MSEEWLVVETLAPDGPHTVIADGSRRKSWATLRRARQAYGPTAASRMVEVVRKCVHTCQPQDEIVTAKRGPAHVRVLGIPVLGAFGAVHGVHVWVGSSTAEPPARRTVAGWHWDVNSELAYQGPGLEETFFATAPKECQVVRSATENFRRVVRFDDRLGYVALCEDVEGGGEWQGEITLRGDDGVVRQVQMVARPHTAGGAREVRGLFHDVSVTSALEPTVEGAALLIVARESRDAYGLVALESALIYEWISAPSAPLDRWVSQRPIFRPSDQTKFEQACARLVAGSERESLLLTIRFAETGWLTVDMTVSRLTSDRAPHGLIKLAVTAP